MEWEDLWLVIGWDDNIQNEKKEMNFIMWGIVLIHIVLNKKTTKLIKEEKIISVSVQIKIMKETHL